MIRNLARYIAAAGLSLFACSGAQALTALASQPLSVGTNVPPNVMFALSVEFPTAITPAYNWASSATSTAGPYLTTKTYLGYFDSGKCYDYNTTYTSGPDPTGTTTQNATFATHAAARYFTPVSLTTTTNTCSGHWAGNFLNWVSMAGLDEFRFAMTGGNRVVDTTTNTVLQRAWQTGQGGNFGEKQLTGSTLVTGATPLSGSSTWYFNSKGQGVQMTFDTTSGGTSNSVYVEVQVCNSTIGLESNCKQYGTSYKPVGAIQNNSSSMKFGVVSYYNSNKIDNGVMRAKSKFVGQYDYTTGTAVANTAQEWDPTTGIYAANPNSADATASYNGAVSQSGVVNYLNLFGLNSGLSGTGYKTYDDVGKLYYVTLSYLKHRTPDTDFYVGATSSNNDGFPVITSWDDPISNYCQKNFIFLMGDAHTWCDKRLPGGSYASTGSSVCAAGTNGNPTDDDGSLSNGDTMNVTTWTNNISSGLATTMTGAGGASYYMGGMAFWAHTNDIRTDLTKPTGSQTNVTTYIIDVQESQDLAINSQFWYAAKYGGFNTANNTITTPASSPLSNWASYDTLYDGSSSNDGSTAAGHGIRPTNYLPAGNPAAMISAVNSAFSAVANSLGETAAVAQSSGNLQFSGGAYLYQGTFTSGIWTGDLSAYAVSVVTAGTTTLPTPSWQASTKLNAGNPSATARVVLTYNDGVSTYTTNAKETATLSREGVGFNALADLSTAQQLALNTSGTGTSDSLATNRISYIRGSQSDEAPNGQKFRARTSLLGDIVNSTPNFIGPPNNASFATGYLAFAVANASRTPVVYVGANDGMLHGFDALLTDTTNVGKELLGYIPSPAVRNLSLLTTAPYNHKYFADGSPVITDACPGSGGCTSQSSWKSVLVSGMNAGGQGMFALDVTNPTNFTMPASGAASSIVMWEFTDNADADLGYTFGMPLIAQMNNGNWAAIFGNGYNNTAIDGQVSTTGAGYLYIVFLAGPTGSSPTRSWTLGTDYIKLKAGNSTTTPGTTTLPNGLGGPVGIDFDLNGTIDYLYAGDLYGNIWKFDVTSATPSVWNTAFSGQPLFTAKDKAGNAQPITAGLAVSFSQYGGFFITFGTGSFIFTTDGATVTTQTLYGILDVNDGSTRIPSSFRTVGVTDGLQQQEVVISGGAQVNGITVTIQSNCLVNYPGLNLTTTANPSSTSTTCPSAITDSGSSGAVAPIQLGWFFDLPNSGERFTANNALVQAGTVDFVTLVPQPGITCTGGASGFEYILNLNTGGATSGTVFDLQGSGLQNAAQMYTAGSGTSYVVSGRALPSGSIINTPGRFILPPSNTTTGAAGSTGGAGGASAGCAGGTFVAGFGCTGIPVNGSIRASNGYGSGNSTGLFLPGQKGRLYWRQLFTQ